MAPVRRQMAEAEDAAASGAEGGSNKGEEAEGTKD